MGTDRDPGAGDLGRARSVAGFRAGRARSALGAERTRRAHRRRDPLGAGRCAGTRQSAPARLLALNGARCDRRDMAARKKLAEYEAKRDFSITNEPAPGVQKPHAFPTFVVHKHDATRLHYDVRLEMDGALASWSVPKGPSYDPSAKRLAIQTEDHPLEDGSFEGRIPDGEYGAGDWLIWGNAEVDSVPPGEWLAEVKYDGYRALSALSNGRLAMWTRNGLDLTVRFPRVARALSQVVVGDAVLDGEVCVLDPSGVPRFELIQQGRHEEAVLFAFDLLRLDGDDLRERPLRERRDLLQSLLSNAPPEVRLAEEVRGPIPEALDQVRQRRVEG